MLKEYQTGEYHGFRRMDFMLYGHRATVIFPKEERTGRPWVWRAEFLGAFDAVDVEMLRRGWHLCYYQISNMFGSPEAVEKMKQFHHFVTAEFHLRERCDLFGFSRGGLYAFHFTCRYPACVSVLYLDAPVLDMRDWPCAEKYEGSFDYTECPKQYHMTREAFLSSRVHPVDQMAQLLAAGTPVVLVAGDADTVVDFRKNGRRLCDFLYANHADYLEIIKKGCDHHPHSVEDPAPIADFIENHQL